MTQRKAAALLAVLALLFLPGTTRVAPASHAGGGPHHIRLPYVSKHTPADPPPPDGCPLGVWTSREGVDVLSRFGSYTHTNDVSDAATYFPQLNGSGTIRAFRGPSLASLQQMADEAVRRGIPFDALAYDLEGWDQTPEWERTHQVEATIQARDLAHGYGKMLIMGPAQAFTHKNWPQMAPYADMWVIQAQAGQRNYPPDSGYYNWLKDLVDLLRPYHRDMPIWAQLSTSPESPLTLSEYMAYVHLVWPSLIDGVYVFNPRGNLPLIDIWQHCCAR